MTTIAQLPPVATVGSSDLLPLTQAGLLYSVSVSQLTASLQPAISVPTGELLGRQSAGAGAPESLTVGTGLALNSGNLAADGADHAGFPVQDTMSLTDHLVISTSASPGLLPVTAIRGLFSAGPGVSINTSGVIAVTASAIAGPTGPTGVAGPVGPNGPQGAGGATGPGLVAPAANNSASAIGASDYVAIWQNGANAWMPYSQFIGGQTINQLPSAGPAADSDELLVAQGSTSLSVQGFGAVWSYMQSKLPTFKPGVVELTASTVLDATDHNNRILVASAPLTLTANFTNMGSGFSCTLINLASGYVTMGTGITSGSGAMALPPGGSTALLGLSYSGGSLVWWNGVVPSAPTITVSTVIAPSPGNAFNIGGGLFNDAPIGLDYSTNGGTTWVVATSPAITATAYSFAVPGLAAGTYVIHVRDHTDIAIIGVSNSFTIDAPTIAINQNSVSTTLNAVLAISGTVSPGNGAVQVGMSSSNTIAPNAWNAATVSGNSWTASVTPVAVGTFYVWAQQTSATTIEVISSAISAVAASLTISAPTTGRAATALNISGAVNPTADAVSVQLATQNTTAPTSGWIVATNTSGSFAATLTPVVAGTVYAWAQDPAIGLSAVSPPIVVDAQTVQTGGLTYGFNNPGGSYVHAAGTIGLNGSVTPAQAVPTQVILSTSNTVAPATGWQTAIVFNNNALWAIYYPTPASPGNYYIWVETTTGGGTAVSNFTVTVT
jgi:hypothetical protein